MIELAKKIKISVVLAAHYRPSYLRKTLQAILQQSYPKQLYEIVVVGYDKDKSLDKLSKQFLGKGVKFLKIGSTFVDKKRNFGVKNAKYEVIAFTDDDCIPGKDWLKNIGTAFAENRNLAGVEGLTWNNNRKLYCHAPENLSGNRFLACNYAFRKDVFNRVNGFDERYHLNYREDTDLAFKVLATGKKIKFVKEARVFHPPIRRALSSPLKDLACVRSDVLLFKKFPRQYTKRFGFVCRGFFKLSAFAWLALAFAVWSVYSGLYFLVLLALAAVFAVKLVAERKGRQCSAKEGLAFVFFSYIRDLAFPFFFAWNWLRIRP